MHGSCVSSFQGKGEVMTYWLIDADEIKKKRIMEYENSLKCHNARIGSQFSVAQLRKSPSLRHKLLGHSGRVTPCSFNSSTEYSSPTILKRPIFKRGRKEECAGYSDSTSFLVVPDIFDALTVEEGYGKGSSLAIENQYCNVERELSIV